MLKVLMVVRDMATGNGVASAIMGYYNTLIERGIKVDFLMMRCVESPFMEIVRNHSDIYIIPKAKLKYSPEVDRYISKLMNEQKYDILHVHIPGPYGALSLKFAEKAGIKTRVYHSHNPRNKLSLKCRISSGIYNPLCVKRASHYMACSSIAGTSIFGDKKFTVLKNLIDAPKFRYNPVVRDRLRKQLGINEKTKLVGTVGRLEKQKNPVFAIKCIEKLVEKNPDVMYIWIGDGVLKKELQAYAAEKGFEKNVFFAGIQDNVYEWYSAMDCFLLPSVFEGLGIVFIEAQASGLPCFGSLAVPEDTEISAMMHRLDVNAGEDYWADKINSCPVNTAREDCTDTVIRGGYDLEQGRYSLADYYDSIKNS